MSGPFFSHAWYRVADVQPRLKAHTRIFPQRFRGVIWYVLQDPQSGRFHRLSEAAHLAVSLMDGERTVAQIWDAVGERLGEHQPTQDEMIHLLRHLHASDLLGGDLRPDLVELTRRSERQARQERLARIRNPIAVRLSLFDPDRMLSRTVRYVGPVFSPIGFLVWLALIGTAVLLAGLHWDQLVSDVTDRALSPSSVALMLVVYPLLKALHELGHGWATKRWGGEVHEIGIMLLLFFPVPYVDASDSAGFASKWQRAVVGSAGIMVELLLASLATFVWVIVEPGLVRALAFDVMLLASVSTVLFNGNPLLRYDGYYVLSDLIEIPNLGPRANQYLAFLTKRWLLRLPDARSPATAPGEAPWFVAYGIASFLYRVSITLVIALYLATKAFFLGVLLAVLAIVTAVLLPLWKGARYLVYSPELGNRRARAITAASAAVLGIVFVLFILPAPYATSAEGVVWVPQDATVRADTSGTVARVLAEPGSMVQRGQPLVELTDPSLESRIAVLTAQQREVRLRLEAALVTDQVSGRMYREQLKHVSAALEQELGKRRDLVVRAGAPGHFAVPIAEDLPGRMVERGALLGYVIDSAHPIVRTVVSQDDIDLILQRRLRTQVRFAQRPAEIREATPWRTTPAAIDKLPTPVLGRSGGGRWAEIADDTGQPHLVQKAFVLDVLVEGAEVPGGTVGSRVFVRFDHGHEAVAWRLIRGLRQLLLRQLDV